MIADSATNRHIPKEEDPGVRVNVYTTDSTIDELRTTHQPFQYLPEKIVRGHNTPSPDLP